MFEFSVLYWHLWGDASLSCKELLTNETLHEYGQGYFVWREASFFRCCDRGQYLSFLACLWWPRHMIWQERGEKDLIKGLKNDGILQRAVPVEACDRMLSDSVSWRWGGEWEWTIFIHRAHEDSVNTSLPCARPRERRATEPREADSNATYGSHQISLMGAILWWQLQVAFPTLPVTVNLDVYIYSAVQAPSSMWENSVIWTLLVSKVESKLDDVFRDLWSWLKQSLINGKTIKKIQLLVRLATTRACVSY